MGWQRWLVSVPAGHRVGTELPRATGPPGAGSASAEASQVQPGSRLHPNHFPLPTGFASSPRESDHVPRPRVLLGSRALGGPEDLSAFFHAQFSPLFPTTTILRLLKCRVRFCVPGSTDGHRVTGCSVRSWWPRKHGPETLDLGSLIFHRQGSASFWPAARVPGVPARSGEAAPGRLPVARCLESRCPGPRAAAPRGRQRPPAGRRSGRI